MYKPRVEDKFIEDGLYDKRSGDVFKGGRSYVKWNSIKKIWDFNLITKLYTTIFSSVPILKYLSNIEFY